MLVEHVGIKNVDVVIAPYDPRVKQLKFDKNIHPSWVRELYQALENEYSKYKKIEI
ncbi:MAG: hypothetical protein R3F37_18620 [Candidatus Competibacteraceae bacterium]